MSTAQTAWIHLQRCPAAWGGNQCICNQLLAEKGLELNQQSTTVEPEMKSLREMRESLAALVTEVRGLREDQQRMNGILVEKLISTYVDIRADIGKVGEAIGQLSLKLGALENAFDEYLGKTLEGITTAISASRESAMRNHCQVADALKDVLVNQVRNGRKLDAIRKQRRGKRRK